MVRKYSSVLSSRRDGVDQASKAERDNRSRQLNPQNDTYWRDRGFDGLPDPFPGGNPHKIRQR